MGEINVNQVDTSDVAFQDCKKLKKLDNSTKILKFMQLVRGVGPTTANVLPQSMALVKEEVKQDSGSSEIREILSHFLGNSILNQRMNCSITGNCLTASLSMLVIV